MNTLTKLAINSAVFCLALTFTTSCSNHDDSKDQAEKTNDDKFTNEGEKAADKLVEACSINLYEIRASENAAGKAVTADVKKLAEMMVAAHTKMNADVQALAQSKNVTLPSDLSDEQRRKMEKLTEKNGIDYDKEYVEQMKNGHDDAIKMLEKAADKSDDAEVKNWASTSLPEIRSHQDMITATWNNIKDMKDNDRADARDGKNDKDHKDHKDHNNDRH